MVERVVRNDEVRGSNPLLSTPFYVGKMGKIQKMRGRK